MKVTIATPGGAAAADDEMKAAISTPGGAAAADEETEAMILKPGGAAAADDDKTKVVISKPDGAAKVPSPHLPAADGARGIGVALVVLYHMGYESFENAWFSISLFFGLSGFLITKNTVEALERNGEVHIVKFWAKRVSRLFPALLATVVVIILSQRLPWRVDDGVVFQREKVDLNYAVVFLTNYNIVYNQIDDYFDEFSNPSVTRHLWTLSIEEQYYIIWPLVVWVLTTAVRKFIRDAPGNGGQQAHGHGSSDPFVRDCLKAILAMDVFIVAGSFVSARATVDKMGMSAAYVSTMCRMGDIAAGGLMYTTVRLVPYLDARFLGDPSLPPMSMKEQILWEIPTAFTLLLEIGMPAVPVAVDDMLKIYFAGGRLIVSFAVFAVVSQAVLETAAGGVPRWAIASHGFTLGPIKTLGIVSYGVYVMHWPLIIYLGDPRGAARRNDPDFVGGFPYHGRNALLLLGVFALGFLSFFYYELPFLKISRRTKPIKTVAAGLLGMAATLGIIQLATIDLAPMVNYDNDVEGDLAYAASHATAFDDPLDDAIDDPRFTPLFFFAHSRFANQIYTQALDHNTRTVYNSRLREHIDDYDGIVNSYKDFEADADEAVIAVCRNFGLSQSPCANPEVWRNGTHWLWVRSEEVCGREAETISRKHARKRCNDVISIYEMNFDASIEEEAGFEVVLAIDEQIPGVLNQNTISKIKRREDDTTDVHTREKWNPITILTLGESVANRIAMFWEEYISIQLPLLAPSHTGLEVHNEAIAGFPSILPFLCTEVPKYSMCSWSGTDTIVTSMSRTKPDVVVVHDSHLLDLDNTGFEKHQEFQDPELKDVYLNLLALNIMLREADKVGVEGVFYFTQSPRFSKKAHQNYDMEIQGFMRFMDVLACKGGGKASRGIRLTVVDWAHLVCPRIATERSCSKQAHGFRSILPDGHHPYGDSGEWLTREALAVVVEEIHRHFPVPSADTAGDVWTNPVTADLLALAPPDGDPPLADLVSSYYVCPFDKSKDLRAAFERAGDRTYADFRDSKNYVE